MPINQTEPEVRDALALLDAKMKAEQKDKKIPGLSGVVVYDQEILWAKGFGYANLEKNIEATPQTIYRIGSITKLFTATMLMQLRDAGKLQLDEPIEKYLPAFKIKSRFSDARPPTFRQAVSHTAGLPREAPFNYWQTRQFPSIEDVLKSLKDVEIIFAPMTEFKYSNLGIAIIGHTLERIVNQPYKQYVKEHILRPLNMNSSGFDLTDKIKADMATGYITAENKPLETAPHLSLGASPAGGLYSSAEDMSRFISLQFRDGPAGGKQILGSSTLREMHSPVFMKPDWKSGITIAWALRRVADHTTIGHTGGIPGFTADITLIPDIKLGIATFTNIFFTDTDWRPNLLNRLALELLIPVIKGVLARQQAEVAVATPADWQKYAGRYSMPGLTEIEIKIIDGKMVVVRPGTSTEIIARLTPEGEHKFRIKGGHVTGELAIFELNETNDVQQVKLGSFILQRK